MSDEKVGNIQKIPLDMINELVTAEPQVPCSEDELKEVLNDIHKAADSRNYYPQVSTPDNPALSDDYVFDSKDESYILKDLQKENFVGKVKDLSKGAKKRREKGYPDEYLYVFKYGCKLTKRICEEEKIVQENVLIYIKVNDRKVPYKSVIIVSFHKNKRKN